MATLASLKKKIAALEAQVEQVTKAEMGAAIAKVRKIMTDFGLTIEHLAGDAPTSRAAKKSPKAKAASKSASKGKGKGSKPPKYQDPATGVTWAGVGRAPAWIANAKNRDDFLIAKADGASESAAHAAPAKKAGKRVPSVKRAMAAAAKKATRKVGATAKRAAKSVTAKASAKKAAPKSAAARKAGTRKVGAKKAVAKTPVAKAPRKRAAAKSATQTAASAPASEASPS